MKTTHFLSALLILTLNSINIYGSNRFENNFNNLKFSMTETDSTRINFDNDREIEKLETLNSLKNAHLDIYYAYNQYFPCVSSIENIKKISQVLSDFPNIKIYIKGWTDFLGKDPYNNKMAW